VGIYQDYTIEDFEEERQALKRSGLRMRSVYSGALLQFDWIASREGRSITEGMILLGIWQGAGCRRFATQAGHRLFDGSRGHGCILRRGELEGRTDPEADFARSGAAAALLSQLPDPLQPHRHHRQP
jgi:hypothetical protein